MVLAGLMMRVGPGGQTQVLHGRFEQGAALTVKLAKFPQVRVLHLRIGVQSGPAQAFGQNLAGGLEE